MKCKDLTIGVTAEGYPALCVAVRDMQIHDPFCSECGRFDVEPEDEYGIPDDIARAMGVINARLEQMFKAEQAEKLKEARYVCVWSINAFVDKPTEDVGFDFFSEENAYTEEDAANIKAMAPGEYWFSPHYGEDHIVYRRK